MNDAVSVHKYLKAKSIAEYNDMTFTIHGETFGLFAKNGKPLKASTKIDDILEELEELPNLGYYSS